MDKQTEIKGNPLTKELYSIDWASRFDQYQKFEESINQDLESILTKVEELIKQSIEITPDLNDFNTLQSRLQDCEPNSKDWHAVAMLINLRTINLALPKRMTHTAALCAMDIMGHLRKSTHETPLKAAPLEEYIAKNTVKNQSAKKRAKPKSQASQRSKPKAVKSTPAPEKKKIAEHAKEAKQEPAVAENVVIKKLTSEVAGDEDKPLSIRCSEVANKLAEEYPQYTLTAIRVMTAEKLGVTRQYVENLDIKPARFKSG